MNIRHQELVRTKVLHLRAHQDDLFRRPIEQLRGRHINVAQYQRCVQGILQSLDFETEFAETIADVRHAVAAQWLVRRHIGDTRYTVQIYRVDPDEAHPPHHHHNLISTQIVLEGAIHLREYERVRRDAEGRLVLRLAGDGVLGPGRCFQASEWKTNVHWFGAVGGPAIIFAIDARGFEDKTFDKPGSEGFGRRYLDPTALEANGLAVCESLDKDEAVRRFGRQPLTSFPVPPHAPAA